MNTPTDLAHLPSHFEIDTVDAARNRHLNFLLQVKLWSKVEIQSVHGSPWEERCWTWKGTVVREGNLYAGQPQLSFRGKTYTAYRVAYTFANGPIPEDLVIRHRCDNSLCCNPAHLETGTDMDNVRDRVARKRTACGLQNGAHTHPHRRPRGEGHRLSMISAETAGRIKGALAILGDRYGANLAIAEFFQVPASVIHGIKNLNNWDQVASLALPDTEELALRGLCGRREGRAATPGRERLLTPDQIRDMRRLFHEAPSKRHAVRDLAAQFDVSRLLVTGILQGKLYTDVATPEYELMPAGGHGNAKLTLEIAQTIRATLAAHAGVEGVAAALARKFELSHPHVSRVEKRVVWADAADDATKALPLAQLPILGSAAPSGTANRLSKLTDANVIELRRGYDALKATNPARGGMSAYLRPAAEALGISYENALFICLRKTWKHIP